MVPLSSFTSKFRKNLGFNKSNKTKKTILTNLHSDLDYNELNKKTPKNVVPAYDGLTINL